MFRKSLIAISFICALAIVMHAQTGQTTSSQGAGRGGSGGWKIPETAATEKNPLTINDSVIAAGKKLFESKCKRCHGPEGKGNGEDADAAHAQDMNLTRADHARLNPDGVVFYKIWNGRTSPKMPVFSQDLTKEQVWAIVAFVQTLRKPS